MSVHIYRADDQPATRFRMDVSSNTKPHIMRFPKRKLLWCRTCRKRRIAANLIAHVYYDDILFFCKHGFGCKR